MLDLVNVVPAGALARPLTEQPRERPSFETRIRRAVPFQKRVTADSPHLEPHEGQDHAGDDENPDEIDEIVHGVAPVPLTLR